MSASGLRRAEISIKMNKNMSNEANFLKSQMFITIILTTSYSEKCELDTWSKRTQSNPISEGGQEKLVTKMGLPRRFAPRCSTIYYIMMFEDVFDIMMQLEGLRLNKV